MGMEPQEVVLKSEVMQPVNPGCSGSSVWKPYVSAICNCSCHQLNITSFYFDESYLRKIPHWLSV